jgi:hypothetical protein
MVHVEDPAYVIDNYPAIPELPVWHDESYCESMYNTLLFEDEISNLADMSSTYSELMRRHKHVHICIHESTRFVTFTLVTNNKAEYLEKMLRSLRVAYESCSQTFRDVVKGLYIFCEPHPECILMCKQIDWIPVYIHTNVTQQGVRQNPFNALQFVFNQVKSTFNVHFEDDLIISPNAIQLVDFYYTRFKTPDRYLIYELFRYISPHDMYIESNFQNKVHIFHGTKHFAGLGWACTRNNWNRHLKPIWFQDLYPDPENTGLRKGWNWTLSHYILSKKHKTIAPAYPHTSHFGERWLGVENPPQNQQIYTDKWTNKEDFNFLIVDRKHATSRDYYIDGIDNVRSISLYV